MHVCIPSSLDIFKPPQVQVSIERTQEVAYKPLTSLENQSTIEFAVAGLSDTYLDLSSTTICLKLQILDKNGNKKVTPPPAVPVTQSTEGEANAPPPPPLPKANAQIPKVMANSS